jgi:hypothetical protein
MHLNDWWTAEHIRNLIDIVFTDPLKARQIRGVIFDNTWIVDKRDIEHYDVAYSKNIIKNFQGGFRYKDAYATYINNVTPIVSRQNFPKE